MTTDNSENLVLRSDRDGVTTLTLNRPDQYNALSEEMIQALQSRLTEIAEDDGVRVVILAANGRAFCAGHDLKQMRGNSEQDYFRQLFADCGKLMTSIINLPQPVIARVHSIATAAGCQLVASCDLAIASEKARFAVSGINVGLFCATPSVALARNIGRKKALEMLFTGEFITAAEAEREGLINRAVADDQLDQTIERLARSICDKSSIAIRNGKAMFYQQLEMGVNDAYQLASDSMACNMMWDDSKEGIDAFMQKRAPEWKHK
ncbi:MAG: enoyl-CoA hydratase [Sedimenticola sp.]|jgi:enoyl-CoA hydratase/carnithine racemase|nr:MAG: enoyl-CoA hydratase [Sedimenticola sp.]